MAIAKVIIQGNVTADIEEKVTASGTSVCNFNVAVNRYSKEPGAAKADFFTVVAWKEKASFISRNFKKGSPILICGRLENREWQDKNGNKRISTEIIAEEVSFVGGGAENATETKYNAPTASQTYLPGAFGGNSTKFEELAASEGLPF
jgi:single-strand DNA-binding protein